MKCIPVFILSYFLISCISIVNAQTDYTLHHFGNGSVLDGLNISKLKLDSYDRLVLTTKGNNDNYFDGKSIIPFGKRDKDFIFSKGIKYKKPLYINENRKIYYASLDGLLLTDAQNNIIKKLEPADGDCDLGPNKITSAIIDANGKIWLISYRNGIYIWDINSNCVQHLFVDNEELNENNIEIRRILQHSYDKNLIVIGHVKGISTININSFKVDHIYTCQNLEPTKIKFLGSDNLLIGTWFSGLFDIDMNTGIAKEFTVSPANKVRLDREQQVSDICIQNDSVAYVAFISQGVYKYSKSQLTPLISVSNENSSSTCQGAIRNICMSNENTIWLLHNNQVSVASLNNEFFTNNIKHRKAKYLIRSPNEDYFLSGGAGDEIIKYDFNFKELKRFSIENLNLNANGKNTICATFYNDKPILAGYNTLFVLNETGDKFVPWKTNLFDLNSDLTEPRNILAFRNNLIIPTKRAGIIEINMQNGKSRRYHLVDKEKMNGPNWHFYRDLKIDAQNRLWIASENGLAYTSDAYNFDFLSRQSKDVEGNMLGLTDRLATSPNGGIWLFNDQMKLFYVNKKNEIQPIQSRLPGTSIKAAVADSNSNIWVLTNTSLVKYEPDLKKYAAWSSADGFNAGQYRSLYIINDSTLSITGKAGHLLINTNEIKEHNVIDIDLIDYQIEDEIRHLFGKIDLDEIVLPYLNNKLLINFLVKQTHPLARTVIQYKLNDENWLTVKESKLSLQNLSGGAYKLSIKASLEANPEKFDIVVIPFIVKIPFYKTGIFYVLSMLLFGLLGWLWFNYKLIQNQKRDKREAELLLKEEKLKSAFDKKIAALEMQSLQVQMNPHFIFNSINSLKGLIMTNDTEKGLDYLQKFSVMVRMILQNSRQKLISLEDEIKLLDIYIAFESLRFESSFKYSISVDPELDTSFITIPPMIIQPFVENAIWHGLLHLTNRSPELTLELFPEEHSVICKITDNGVGRAATLANKNTNKIHNSLGTSITEERLAVYEKITGKSIQIKYIDLYKAKKATGTQVVITMSDSI